MSSAESVPNLWHWQLCPFMLRQSSTCLLLVKNTTNAKPANSYVVLIKSLVNTKMFQYVLHVTAVDKDV